MIFKKIFGLLIAILFLPSLWVEAQEHHFTNPQVRVKVTTETLNISTTGYSHHKWERVNPNRPSKQNFNFKIPRHPKIASRTTAVPTRGPIKVALNGVFFSALKTGKVKLRWKIMGSIRAGVYHYHCTPGCVYKDAANQHSPVVGYAFDGFKIYGLQGERGRSPKDLDSCNGHKDKGRGLLLPHHRKFPLCAGLLSGYTSTSELRPQPARHQIKE